MRLQPLSLLIIWSSAWTSKANYALVRKNVKAPKESSRLLPRDLAHADFAELRTVDYLYEVIFKENAEDPDETEIQCMKDSLQKNMSLLVKEYLVKWLGYDPTIDWGDVDVDALDYEEIKKLYHAYKHKEKKKEEERKKLEHERQQEVHREQEREKQQIHRQYEKTKKELHLERQEFQRQQERERDEFKRQQDLEKEEFEPQHGSDKNLEKAFKEKQEREKQEFQRKQESEKKLVHERLEELLEQLELERKERRHQQEFEKKLEIEKEKNGTRRLQVRVNRKKKRANATRKRNRTKNLPPDAVISKRRWKRTFRIRATCSKYCNPDDIDHRRRRVEKEELTPQYHSRPDFKEYMEKELKSALGKECKEIKKRMKTGIFTYVGDVSEEEEGYYDDEGY